MKIHTIPHPVTRTLCLAALAALFSLSAVVHSTAAVFTVNAPATDDNYVEVDNPTSVKGSGLGAIIRTKNGGATANRISYLKFDLGGYNPTTSPATFSLWTQDVDSGGPYTMQIWALKSGWSATGVELGADWLETEITWDNAPALGTTAASDTDQDFRVADATQIDTFAITSGQDETEFSTLIPSLLPYLHDKTITFMIKVQSGGSGFVDFHSQENVAGKAPILTFESATVPEPGTLSFFLTGGLVCWARTRTRNRRS